MLIEDNLGEMTVACNCYNRSNL